MSKFKVEDRVYVNILGYKEPATIIDIDETANPETIGQNVVKFDDGRFSIAHYKDDELELMKKDVEFVIQANAIEQLKTLKEENQELKEKIAILEKNNAFLEGKIVVYEKYSNEEVK